MNVERTNKPATVRWWYHFDDPKASPGGLIAEFEKANPKISIHAQSIPWGGGSDYDTRLYTALIANHGPDTAMVKLRNLPQLVEMEALLPIDQYLNGWTNKSDISDAIWKLHVVADGQHYYLPLQYITTYLYLRQDWFEKEGLQTPKTFDNFLTAARALTDNDRWGFGLRGDAGGVDFWCTFVIGGGAEFRKDGLSGPAALAANQWHIDLYRKYKVMTVTTSGANDWNAHPKRFVDATTQSLTSARTLPLVEETADFVRLGCEFARFDPRHDRGRTRYSYANASTACDVDRLVRRRLWERLGARRNTHPDSAGRNDLLPGKEARTMNRRLKTLVGTELPMLAVLAFALGPWFWMLLSSIRPERDMTRTPLAIWPSTLTLAHHIELLERTSFVENLRDSLIVAAGTVTVGLGLALPAAYAFTRFRFRSRTAMRSLFLIINMFPIVMLILPLFILLRQLRLLDTYFALISAHATFTLPFAIWLLTSYMDGIPAELDQAALIDGASRWQAMRFVILPLVRPGMVAVGIYLFITSWNEYLFATVHLRTQPAF